MSIASARLAFQAPWTGSLRDYGPKLLFATLFVAPLVAIACGPAFVAFGVKDFYLRVVQTVWCVGALWLGVLLSRSERLRLSMTARFVGIFLFVSAMIQLAVQNLTPGHQYQFESMQATLLFLTGFLGMDLLARRTTFKSFCEDASPLAALIVLISAIHITFFAVRTWGRAGYFGQHPNLGGEILFGAIAVIALNRRVWLRYVVYALAMYTLFQLQARAAMLGGFIVIAIAEMPRTKVAWRNFPIVAAGVLVAVSLVILTSPAIGAKLDQFITEDVLMLNNPYRGSGTGFSGRAGTWAYGLGVLLEHPLLGSGLNLSGENLILEPIHSGYVKNVVEFGIPGMALNLVLLFSIISAFRADLRRGAIVLGGCVIYMFNARNVNLNIFPFILWIAILPWYLPPKQTARRVDPYHPV